MTDAELVKSKLDIVSFISALVPLKKAGRHFKACCPFHTEKTPSFLVSGERQTWHCFGSCGEGGDIISFVQKWENVEFYDALKILADRAGVSLSSSRAGESGKQKERLLEIHRLACSYYHFLLIQHAAGADARAYMNSRGIGEKLWETFSLGYAAHSWHSLLRFLQKKGFSSSELVTAGVVCRSPRNTFYDRFRGRLMFPLHDHHGAIIGFSGRLLSAGSTEAKYVNSPETPLYIKGNTLYGLHKTKDSIKAERLAILVEGEFDFLSSFQAGVPNVVAVKGSALTPVHARLLSRFCDRVAFSFDTDAAGIEAIRRGIPLTQDARLSASVIRLPVGKDPAECIAEGVHLWKQAVQDAVEVFDFLLATSLSRHDVSTAGGKERITDEILPLLASFSNPIVQSHYTKRLAHALSVSEEAILLAIQKSERRATPPHAFLPSSPPPSSPDSTEDYLLSLLVQSESLALLLDRLFTIVSPDDFSSATVRAILERLRIFLRDSAPFSANRFAASIPSELVASFDRAFARDISHLLSEPGIHEKTFVHTALQIKQRAIRRKILRLSTNIRQAEDAHTDSRALHEELKHTIDQLREIEKSIQMRL